jgi:tetratricopeptide (TPR) repeat protein
MKRICPVCKTTNNIAEETLKDAMAEPVCEKCGGRLRSGRDLSTDTIPKTPNKPFHRPPSNFSKYGELPSVLDMRPEGKAPRDYLALGVLVVALMVLIIAGYSLIKNLNTGFIQKPLTSIFGWVDDLDKFREFWGGAFRKQAPGQRAEKHMRRGHSLYKKRDYDKALSEYNQAIRMNPESVEAYFWRGRAFIKTGRYNEATVDFMKATELNPRYAEAYNNLGWLFGRRKKYDESIYYLDRAIKLAPEGGWAYFYRGRMYSKKGDKQSALKDIKKACRLKNKQACRAYSQLKIKK